MDEPISSNATANLLQNSDSSDPVPAHHANPVVAFIIGLAIILLASIMNAAGLNLTKLDHVRTSAIPKASRRKDWLRPLWLLGMLLYILSQLVGSTLALEYMRAEYVAPLGSTSLVFNFLFARFLVGTPVTSTDIYGTIIVILGVVGIVAFGSINSGLTTETDVAHLTILWRRGGWLGFFFAMASALILLFLFTSMLDAVLVSRSDISSVPFAGMAAGASTTEPGFRRPGGRNWLTRPFTGIKKGWGALMLRITQLLELWTAAKDDTTIAWTLGIGWACCGGGLAGGTLVFAKATVKLLSGSLSHENPGNQFGHAAPIFTIILLAITAVLQIICLNRGLKVYDSTLVVPVFYGVYTATGFLDSLIFNNEVGAYQTWTLFLIFVSILILISGVVLLTHKKPDAAAQKSAGVGSAAGIASQRQRTRAVKRASTSKISLPDDDDDDDADDGREHSEHAALWAVGEVSDGEDDGEDADIDHHQHPLRSTSASNLNELASRRDDIPGEEGLGLMTGADAEEGEVARRRSLGNSRTSQEPFRDDPEEFGEWAQVKPLRS